MNGYKEDISSNLENSRNSLRKIGRHNDTEFSKNSILKDMERFVKSVNVMDETVLVPCKLMDIRPHSDAEGEDLFRMFSLLNELKIDLLWSRSEREGSREPARPAKRMPRRPSAASVASTSSATSATSADSDSEASCVDSGIEGAEEFENGTDEKAARAAAACRRHLRGLRRSLRQLTSAADQLTQRYQDDVGPA